MTQEISNLVREITRLQAKLHINPHRRDYIKSKLIIRYGKLIDKVKGNSEVMKNIQKREKKALELIDKMNDTKEIRLKARLKVLIDKLKVLVEKENKEIKDNVWKNIENPKIKNLRKPIGISKGKIITASIIASLMTASYLLYRRAEERRLKELKKRLDKK
jgi:hypothetical protein